MIAITIDREPDLKISLGLPPQELAPNADLGMPSSLAQARARVGAINAAVQNYKSEAWATALEAIGKTSMSLRPTGAVLLLTFFWPSSGSKAARDGDNASASFKAGQDGIAKALRLNDKRIAQLPPRFAVDTKKPRVEVETYFDRIEWRIRQ